MRYGGSLRGRRSGLLFSYLNNQGFFGKEWCYMKTVKTFSEYMKDETRVSVAEREKINFEIELIGKMIEAREKKGLS